MQITDETSIAGYLNFLAIYADRGWEDLQTDYAAELALAGDPDALVAHVALLLAGDAFSEATARRIATALRDIPPERPRDRARRHRAGGGLARIPGAEMTATRHADAGRRAFLLRACALGAAGAAAPLAANLAALGAAAAQEASAGSYKALVCVFLYGGNDPYNTIVPYDEASHRAYAAARADIALPRESLHATILGNGPEANGMRFALAPSLAPLAPCTRAGAWPWR